MENSENKTPPKSANKMDDKLFKRLRFTNIYSGLGFGLLLGLIMGLAVSPVVQTIMGVLTAVLGAYLGVERKDFSQISEDAYQKENTSNIFTGYRVGSFGFAVVVGLLFGMLVRTTEMFTPSIKTQVDRWTEAGYDKEYAKKLVAFERLAIDINTGEIGEMTEVQKSKTSVLYSSEQAANLCASMDPDAWDNNIDIAKAAIKETEEKALIQLSDAIVANVPDTLQFDFLHKLYDVICTMGDQDTEYCKKGTDIAAWENDKMANGLIQIVKQLPTEQQSKMMKALSEFACEMEKE